MLCGYDEPLPLIHFTPSFARWAMFEQANGDAKTSLSRKRDGLQISIEMQSSAQCSLTIHILDNV